MCCFYYIYRVSCEALVPAPAFLSVEFPGSRAMALLSVQVATLDGETVLESLVPVTQTAAWPRELFYFIHQF